MTRNTKLAVALAGSLAAALAVVIGLPPVPQLESYHGFADQRVWAGIPNAGDVLSNLPFAVVGLWGLIVLHRTPEGAAFRSRAWTVPYTVFFAGVAAVCLGSAYYHWSPTNQTLVWDRLPMSVAFMAIFMAVIASRLGDRTARILFLPALVFGFATVIYWAMTDDLRPYYIVQFLPIVMVPVISALFPAGPGLADRHVAILLGGYVFAKVLETYDWPIWNATGEFVSGHSLKHIAAALSCFAVVAAIRTSGITRDR